MHDIKLIREQPKIFEEGMRRRGLTPDVGGILAEDEQLRTAITNAQDASVLRNQSAQKIGLLKRQGVATDDAEQLARQHKADVEHYEALISSLRPILKSSLETLPNVLDADVPNGADETANVEQKRIGAIPDLGFTPRQHFELGEALGMMDFEAAARLAGSRFTILRGPLARLERALGQFMIDLHTTEHGYQETSVPTLVNAAAVYGTSQLPKFAEDLFRTTDDRYLIPTAEVPLTNLVAGQIIPPTSLPLRLTALTDCYRAEAGSAGRDTRGMLRQHQFRKVELVSITTPEASDAEHERMTRCAETVLERLNLPYRRMLLCAGDTGFAAAKTYDLEVWLPGQGMWREISSCSNCRDFQARRMQARTRGADGKSTRMVHTLNGSGVAVGRALIAVMENFQQADGSIAVPEVLHSYTGGLHRIAK